jgi:hypothetical protein
LLESTALAPNESAHIATLITALTDEVRGYREDTRVLNTKLFGDPSKENEHGRIPALEKTVTDQGKRIRSQEKLSWAARAIVGFIVLVSGLAYEISNIKGH